MIYICIEAIASFDNSNKDMHHFLQIFLYEFFFNLSAI